MSLAPLSVALVVAFAPVLLAMGRVWAGVPYYSHGFLVPVFAFAAYQPIAARLGKPAHDRRGTLALGAALALYMLGLATASLSLQGLALVGAVAGLVLYRFGAEGLRRLAFPVFFLIFMVPLPSEWVSPLVVSLQLWVSSVSVAVLQGAGVDVIREGNVLRLASGESLFVAEACSGITSLLTLTALATLLAYYSARSLPRRLLLVLAAVPAALLSNLLRVVATVLAAAVWGVDRVTGNPLHELGGLLAFALACLGLLGLAAWLGEPRRRAMQDPAAMDRGR